MIKSGFMVDNDLPLFMDEFVYIPAGVRDSVVSDRAVTDDVSPVLETMLNAGITEFKSPICSLKFLGEPSFSRTRLVG